MKVEVEIQSADGRFKCTFQRGQDDYYYVKYPNKMDEPFAAMIVDAVKDIRERAGKKIVLVADVSEMTDLGAAARKRLADYLLGEDAPLKAFAVVGGNFYMRQLTNLYARIAISVPLKGVSNQQEARAWLARTVQDD